MHDQHTPAFGAPAAFLTRALGDEDPEVRALAEDRLRFRHHLAVHVRSTETFWRRFRPHERSLQQRYGLPNSRSALYAHHLSRDGFAHLTALLESRDYHLVNPEEASLLAVAWLVRAGHVPAALRLMAALEPQVSELPLTPLPGASASGRPTRHRDGIAEVAAQLRADAARPQRPRNTKAARTGNPGPRALAQHEALTVWNPFTDRVLTHWLATLGPDGRVDAHRPDGWTEQATALLAEYGELAEQHPHCTKHRKPKENLAVLLAALRDAVPSNRLTARRRGLLCNAVTAMLRKRGTPGSAQHAALRSAQATQDALTARPVPEAAPAPASRFPSNEILAKALVHALPGVRIALSGTGTDDPALAHLLTEHQRTCIPHYPAHFWDHRHPRPRPDPSRFPAPPWAQGSRPQRPDRHEPWLQALRAHLSHPGQEHEAHRALLVEVHGLYAEAFPASPLASNLAGGLNRVSATTGSLPPFLPQVATHTFFPEFSPRFAKAARLAADQLADTVYSRYYGIDTALVRALPEERREGPEYVRVTHNTWRLTNDHAYREPTAFARLCRTRTGMEPGSTREALRWGRRRADVADSMMIEQAQVLTTHNLATLVDLGWVPESGWADLALRAHTVTSGALLDLHHGVAVERRLRRAATSWRQSLFYLSHCTDTEQRQSLARMVADAAALPAHTRPRMEALLAGLAEAVEGTRAADSTQFLGWSWEPHWLLSH
ncbi:hypothetical protein [Nocardiopsis oceani]